MQRTHRGVALDTVFDENSTRRGIFIITAKLLMFEIWWIYLIQLNRNKNSSENIIVEFEPMTYR